LEPKSERRLLEKNSRQSVCPWKGVASYYDVVVEGKNNPGAAWFYPDPSAPAKQIEDYVAFWRGVSVRSAER